MTPTTSNIELVHDDWCHWGDGCCGCKCGAVPIGTYDPSIDDERNHE